MATRCQAQAVPVAVAAPQLPSAVYCSTTGCCLMWHTGCGVGRGTGGDAHFHLSTEEVLLSSQAPLSILGFAAVTHSLISQYVFCLNKSPINGRWHGSLHSQCAPSYYTYTSLLSTCGSRGLCTTLWGAILALLKEAMLHLQSNIQKLTKSLHKYLRSALPIIHNTNISLCRSAHPWLTPSTDSAGTVISLKKSKSQDSHICYCSRDGKRRLDCLKRRWHLQNREWSVG